MKIYEIYMKIYKNIRTYTKIYDIWGHIALNALECVFNALRGFFVTKNDTFKPWNAGSQPSGGFSSPKTTPLSPGMRVHSPPGVCRHRKRHL